MHNRGHIVFSKLKLDSQQEQNLQFWGTAKWKCRAGEAQEEILLPLLLSCLWPVLPIG